MDLPEDFSTACQKGTLSTVQALVEAGDINIDAIDSVHILLLLLYYYYYYYYY